MSKRNTLANKALRREVREAHEPTYNPSHREGKNREQERRNRHGYGWKLCKHPFGKTTSQRSRYVNRQFTKLIKAGQ